MPLRKTRIVATMGPACAPEKVLRELLHAGVNVCRLNFSHGSHEQHSAMLDKIRRAEADLGRPVAVLQDLCGPKIRTSKLPGGEVPLRAGNEVDLVAGLAESDDAARIGVSYDGLADEVRVDQRVLLDDGLLELRVLATDPARRTVRCRVVYGGGLKNNKGVNFPDSELRVPSLTDKDRHDLQWGLKNGVDYVALSFVRHEDDVAEVRRLMAGLPDPPRVIAKIEKPQAVQRLEQIMEAFDGVMVARGDLSVEMALYDVPGIQKRIIRLAIQRDKPVITATQMLDSMQEHPRPTRAEVSDVANAIHDGTDAVMLSGESASGKYPVEAVTVMRQIAEATERDTDRLGSCRYTSDVDLTSFADSICGGALSVAESLHACCIVTFTSTGRTALLMSKYQPTVPVLGVTSEPRALRRMCLYRGVVPVLVPPREHSEDLTHVAEAEILRRELGKKGDPIVVVGGSHLAAKGSNNSLKIRRLGEAPG